MSGGVFGACKVLKKTFKFSDDRTQETLCVAIPEVIDPAYGMYVWPCAPVLAQYVWFHRQYLLGKRVLEVGAGTALPGVVAAKCGAQVTLSDSAQYPKCMENCKVSCKVNGLSGVTVVGLTWGHFSTDFLTIGDVDIILGSDCFYDKKDFEDIFATVSFLMDKNPGCQFWCSYQERSTNWSIAHLLSKWQLTCNHVSLSTFEANTPSLAESGLPGNHTIHMLIFKKQQS